MLWYLAINSCEISSIYIFCFSRFKTTFSVILRIIPALLTVIYDVTYYIKRRISNTLYNLVECVDARAAD